MSCHRWVDVRSFFTGWRVKLLEVGPERCTVSSAELFYLHRTRHSPGTTKGSKGSGEAGSTGLNLYLCWPGGGKNVGWGWELLH
eukprot:4403258-Karenia_brevis.AAC.1